MQTLYDNIRNMQAENEKALKRFTLLTEHLFPHVTLLENQLEECLAENSLYDKFVAIDLNVAELATYALCALIGVSNPLKERWKKLFM